MSVGSRQNTSRRPSSSGRTRPSEQAWHAAARTTRRCIGGGETIVIQQAAGEPSAGGTEVRSKVCSGARSIKRAAVVIRPSLPLRSWTD